MFNLFPHIVQLEGETVGKLLCQLIMKTVYSEGMEVIEFIKRLKRLIVQCPRSAENLFRWSSHVLTVKNANFVSMIFLCIIVLIPFFFLLNYIFNYFNELSYFCMINLYIMFLFR